MDHNRHKADSIDKYRLFFDLLHGKMVKYKILPKDTYNMDEKGFLLGILTRLKRLFDRAVFDSH